MISRSIVESLRESEIPSRFIQRCSREVDGKEIWIDIGDKKAWEKTSQLLREMASKGNHKTVYQKRKWDKEIKRRKRNDEKRKMQKKSSLKSPLSPFKKYQPSITSTTRSNGTFLPARSTDTSKLESTGPVLQSVLPQYFNTNVASRQGDNINVDHHNANFNSMLLNPSPTVGNLGQTSLQNSTKFASPNMSPPLRSLSNHTSRSIIHSDALSSPFRNSVPRSIRSLSNLLNHALSTQQQFVTQVHPTKFLSQENSLILGSLPHDYLKSMLIQQNLRLNLPTALMNLGLNSIPTSVLMNPGQRNPMKFSYQES